MPNKASKVTLWHEKCCAEICMKVNYYLLFLGCTSLAIARPQVSNENDPFEIVQQENTKDVFIEENKQIFDNDNMRIYEEETSAAKESSYTAIGKVVPTMVRGSRTQDAMLTISGTDVKVNSKIFSDNLCRDCLQLTEYLYLGTKRYDETHRVYPGAFSANSDLSRPPLYETLKNKNIEVFAPIYGTNGGREGAYIGMLAYRKTADHLELFVVFEGSQGESFEFLNGIGGASWRTNFQSAKVEADAQALNLPKVYGKLSFHEGYYNKVYTSKIFWEEKLEALFSHLGIKKFSEFKPQNSGNVTQQDVDNWRGFSVDVYIFGHSQGGGLTQIGAPYITATIGQMLYGDTFDNKTFNIAHAICMSPARAIGDEHTMDVVQDVMGKENIFGWCSPIDLVPCLPLGYNINKRPMDKIRTTVGLKILGFISKFLPKKLSEFISVISETKFCYETLPIFAYVDPCELFTDYAETGLKIYRDYLDMIEKSKVVGNKKECEDQIKNFEEIKKEIPKIREIITSMQENYFNAHTSNWFTSKYYALKAAHYLKKLLKKVSLGDLMGAQHWGAPVMLKNTNSDKNIWVETLFHSEKLDSNVLINSIFLNLSAILLKICK